MKKILVSLSGVSSAGKTTAFENLKKFFSAEDCLFFNESIRENINAEEFKKIIKNCNFLDLQLKIFNKEIERLQNIKKIKQKIIIFDRSIFDVAIYSYLYSLENIKPIDSIILTNLSETALKIAEKYFERIFILRKNIHIEDGYRLGEDWSIKEEKILNFIISKFGTKRKIKILTKDLNQNILIIKNYIKSQLNLF